MRRWVPLLLLVASSAAAEELSSTAELSGYFETRHTGVFGLDTDFESKIKSLGLPIDFDTLGFHPSHRYGVVNRLRPTLKLHVGEKATAVATVEGHSYHGFFKRTQDEIGDVVSVERLDLTLSDGVLDVAAGKMLFPWGHGLLLNPTDLFVERPPGDLRAELPGVWAVKALFGLGTDQNLTAIVATHEDGCCHPFVIGRYDLQVGVTDGAATVAWDEGGDRAVFGLDVKSEAEVGFWVESSFTLADLKKDSPRWYFDVEAGVDYTFDVLDGLYVAAEYLRQGEGRSRDYTSTVLTADPKRRTAFLGKDYAALLIRWTINNDWQLQVLNLVNAHDPSGIVVPQLTWLPLGSLELILGANIAYGKKGGEYAMTIPDEVAVPGVGTVPAPDSVRGERLVPLAQLFLSGRYYF